MSDNKELSTDALQASIESLTQDNEQLKTQVEEKTTEIDGLTSQLEAKGTEVSRLADDMSAMQGTVAKDYATIVAQYRILLGKPGTDGLDEKEAREAFVDELAKRSVESLRDSLTDLCEEYKIFLEAQAADDKSDSKNKRKGPSVEDDKLETPSLQDSQSHGAKSTKSSKPKSANEAVDAAFEL